jgi:hypothetical protein
VVEEEDPQRNAVGSAPEALALGNLNAREPMPHVPKGALKARQRFERRKRESSSITYRRDFKLK